MMKVEFRLDEGTFTKYVKEIEKQIIDKKMELIGRLEDDIEQKDEEYLNLLKCNKEDINSIIDSMHT